MKACLPVAICILSAFRACLALSNTIGMPSPKLSNLNAPNYFIVGLGSHRTSESREIGVNDRTQAKFQVNINFRLAGWEESRSGFYFGYSQLSFWHIFNPSSPFFENNYRPEAFFYYDAAASDETPWYKPALKLSLVHESNGLSGDTNRGWDRIVAAADFGESPEARFSAGASFWYILGQSHNLDDYLGRGELRFVLNLPRYFDRLKIGIGVTSRFRYKEPQFINYELNTFFNPFADAKSGFQWLPSFMVQYFNGKGENMREYNRHVSSLRIGVAFL